ncbi:hypothetical protein KY311_03915 [Candidatus Woesearchaeota archaeon]|nr:hypothetical protein [Candidatus Woesearchaeota archaeon]MBW3017386.1 hypothetical protein [Candidatus Woesearchaeota archaeon]
MITQTYEKPKVQAQAYDIYSPHVEINRPIAELNGLTVRKIANLIHNSLMLVEHREGIYYNTASRLYDKLTAGLTGRQKNILDRLLYYEYGSDDKEFKYRYVRLKQIRKFELVNTKEIKLGEDLAADIMSDIMFNVAKANANFARTMQTGDLRLEDIAAKYIGMEDELKEKGINLSDVLHEQINHIDHEYGKMYRGYISGFMDKYNDQKASAKEKLNGQDVGAAKTLEEYAAEYAHEVTFVDEQHQVVAKDELKGTQLFDISKGNDGHDFLGLTDVLNGA